MLKPDLVEAMMEGAGGALEIAELDEVFH